MTVDVVDQAVVDAEFVAIVLAEHPWDDGQGEPSPRTPPPTAPTRTRREPPPSGRGPGSAGPTRRVPTVAATPQVRRRTGPGPRSPPSRVVPPPPSTRR
ncbi:hypothetical protein GCM10023200_07310 [Actinomycetospora chlora]|uniref:Uncharacterized protein n=1 Tax=Actinomycetospora chlora TaxID=663608 RepID=A0ABP9ABI3_9PSEU